MKVQSLLCAGAVAGLAALVAPVLSQDTPSRPQPPSGARPTTPGGQDRPQDRPQTPGAANPTFRNAVNALAGNWEVSVRTFAINAGGRGSQAAPTSQTQGNSMRQWILNGKVLQETVRVGEMSLTHGNIDRDLNEQVEPAAPPGRPATPRPQPPRGGESMGDTFTFEGHGMFGYDSRNNQFLHVWADNTDSVLTPSVGTYDERTKTFTFIKHEATGPAVRPMPGVRPDTTPETPRTPSTPPGTTPPSTPRPGGTPPGGGGNMEQVSPTTPSGQDRPPRPDRQPITEREPMTHRQFASEVQRIVVRIESDTRHVVEYFTGPATQQSKVMELTYTKSR